MEKIKLSNGMYIHAIAFGPGVFGQTSNSGKRNLLNRAYNKIRRLTIDKYRYINAVTSALKTGFRTIDFSAAYGSGNLIGAAIKKSGIPRNELVITTRVSNKAQFSGNIEEELIKQMQEMEVDYIDILMFHWPVTGCYEKTWQKMIELKEKGYCRTLGVANCKEHHLKRLKDISGIYPVINQFEVHPLFTQEKLRKYCFDNNIQVEAYTPTGRQDDRLLNPPLLNELSKKYGKTKTQIILRWHVQHGIIPVIRTFNQEHQKSDIDIFDFEISIDDMQKIDSMNINSRLRYDPDNCDFRTL